MYIGLICCQTLHRKILLPFMKALRAEVINMSTFNGFIFFFLFFFISYYIINFNVNLMRIKVNLRKPVYTALGAFVDAVRCHVFHSTFHYPIQNWVYVAFGDNRCNLFCFVLFFSSN